MRGALPAAMVALSMSELGAIDGYELCTRVLNACDWDAGALIVLAGGSESDWLEFKAACGPPVGEPVADGCNADDYYWHIAQAVIALANTHGGCLLLGVDDAGKAIGLTASDPKSIRGRRGWDEYLRHLDQTVLRPSRGWSGLKAGRICVENPPHDLVELHGASHEGEEIVAILVHPRPAGAGCIHCIEGPPEKERDLVLVRDVGGVGRVRELARASAIADWEKHREPQQAHCGELLAKFLADRRSLGAAAEPRGIEERIAVYHAGLRRSLEKVDRCFVSLDAEEAVDLEVGEEAMQPWAEEYFREDFPDEFPEEEEEDDDEGEEGDEEMEGLVSERIARSGGVFDLLAAEPRAILLGEPGGGKTTCLQRLALRARGAYQPGGRLALFVPLSRYQGAGDLKPLMVRATCFSESTKSGLSEADLEYLAQSDRLILLLDALNECPEAQRLACESEIFQMLRRHPRLPVTLSARTIGWRSGIRLPAFMIRPLDERRQAELLRNYLGDAASAEVLHRKLLALHGGVATASNPLILRMAVQIFAEDRDLPAGRALLYRRFVGIWYLRESRKAEHAGAPLPWDESTTRGALAHLAFTARAEGGRVMGCARALEILAGHMAAPADFLQKLGQGFLLRCHDEQVDLVHETFQEYLAAEYCLAVPDALERRGDSDYGRWGMVLAYAAELYEGLPPEILPVAWKLNPWLAAALAPIGEAAPEWDIVGDGWSSGALDTLKAFFSDVPIAGIKQFSGKGWYSRTDAPLSYAVATFRHVSRAWYAMEVQLLSLAWHPGMAAAFLRHCISKPTELMADAWPAYRGGGRSWRVPKPWLDKARPDQASQFIGQGILEIGDYALRRNEAIKSATPRQAREWIEAGLLSAADFTVRRPELIRDSTSIGLMVELIGAGICAWEDFGRSKAELVATAGIPEAAMLIKLGVCSAPDFESRKSRWVLHATGKDARHLLASGICAARDFEARRGSILRTERVSSALQWIKAGICSVEDYRSRVDWHDTANIKEAKRLIQAGICKPKDFAHRKQALARNATPKQKKKLVKMGVCSLDEIALFERTPPSVIEEAVTPDLRRRPVAERKLWPMLIVSLISFAETQCFDLSPQQDFLDSDSPLKGWNPPASEVEHLRRAMRVVKQIIGFRPEENRKTVSFSEAFARPGLEWQELRRLAETYLSSRGFDPGQVLEIRGDAFLLPEGYKFAKENLQDGRWRAAIALALKDRWIEAVVEKDLGTFAFLVHPDFTDNIFCHQPPVALEIGNRVACQVVVRYHEKSRMWGFVAKGTKLVTEACDEIHAKVEGPQEVPGNAPLNSINEEAGVRPLSEN